MMEYKGYLGEVEFDEDAQLLHGRVIGIRDVITFQADKLSKIEKAFHDSVDDYLAFCKERGEAPDKPFSGNFVVRMDQELHRRLSMAARLSGQSLNTLIQEYLRREVDKVVPETSEKPEVVTA